MYREIETPVNFVDQDTMKLISDFTAYFSRMEYCLKRANYGQTKKNGKIFAANWDKYAKDNEEAFEKCPVLEICPTISNKPPNEQYKGEDGRIKWKYTEPDGKKDSLLYISLSLRRVRNNLFHGGKFQVGGEMDFQRSTELLKEGIELIKYLVAMDDKVNKHWSR